MQGLQGRQTQGDRRAYTLTNAVDKLEEQLKVGGACRGGGRAVLWDWSGAGGLQRPAGTTVCLHVCPDARV